jgi:hypothetical protein
MSLLTHYRQAARDSGRPLAALLKEALQFRLRGLGTGHALGFSEYLDFSLHLHDLDATQKQEFLGYRSQRVLEETLIDDYSRLLSLDKLTMYALMRGHGLPTPALRASYGAARPAGGTSWRVLTTPAALAAFLREPGTLPLYCKPSFGAYGRGNVLIESLDGDHVNLSPGGRVPLADFVATLDVERTLGWVLQEPLTPHPDVQALTGSNRISGLRIHSFASVRGPQVTHMIFKINAGQKVSDNFEHGASGNLLAGVNVDTGRIERVISGVGPGQQRNPRLPLTGRQLEGETVPLWREARELVLQAHLAFPGYLLPGWDVALCADGPKLLEVNAFGDVDLGQHAYRRGFLDARLRTLLRERGLEESLFSAPKRSAVSASNGRRGARRHHWPW